MFGVRVVFVFYLLLFLSLILAFFYVFFEKSSQVYAAVGQIHLNHDGCGQFVGVGCPVAHYVHDVEGIPTSVKALPLIAI